MLTVLLAVTEGDSAGIGVGEPAGDLFGAVDGTMLAASASKSHLKGGKVSLKVFLNALSHNSFYMIKESIDGWFLLQEFDDGTVLAGISLVFGVAAWVGQRTAVEDETAAVAGGISGEAFFEAKGENGDSELRISRRKLR